MERVIAHAPVAVVSGSGLRLESLLDDIDWKKPFDALPGLSGESVQGHPGVFIAGHCGAVPILLQCGRRHFYEGLTFEQVTASVRALHAMGARRIVFTNAAGGLRPGLAPGTLLGVDRALTWPCRGWPGQPEALQPDTVLEGCDASGTYVWVHGPSYETRAEIRALQEMGACAVGMSTVPELQAARELSLRTAVVSCITNNCCNPAKLTHEDVVETAGNASRRLASLLRTALPALAAGE